MNIIEISGEEVTRGVVESDWIDDNDHMNVAYYILAFDRAIDSFWRNFGMTNDFIKETHSSTFAVESHIKWQKEMRLNEPYLITTQVLAYDSKRIHQFMRMYHAEKKFVAATIEWLNLHVDLSSRKVSPWPEIVLHKISDFVSGHQKWNWPKEAGVTIQIPTSLKTHNTTA